MISAPSIKGGHKRNAIWSRTRTRNTKLGGPIQEMGGKRIPSGIGAKGSASLINELGEEGFGFSEIL